MSKFDLKTFVENPSVEILAESDLLKNDWLDIAGHFQADVRRYWKKSRIANEVIKHLVDLEVLDEAAFDLCEEEDSAIKLKLMELELEREKMKEKERKRERKGEEKEREREKKRKFSRN